MKRLTSAMLICLGLGVGLGLTAAHAAEEAPAGGATISQTLSEGEIRKVDKAAGKVTIKHGPLQNLGMPGMVMIFRVKDPAWLDQMKAGDKIRFLAEKVNGMFTVVRYEPVN